MFWQKNKNTKIVHHYNKTLKLHPSSTTKPKSRPCGFYKWKCHLDKQVPKQTPGPGGKRNWHTKAYKNLSVLHSSASNRVKMTRSALMLYIFANNEDSSSRRQLSVLWMQSMESVFDKGMCKTVLLWHSAWGCREFHSSQPVALSTVHNIWSQLER